MDYLGGFQYQDNVLKHFPTAAGYVSHVSGSYQYVYNYTDHLGNIRLSYGWDSAEAKLKIMEENHYYPFGMKHANYNTHTLSAMKMEEGSVMTLKAMAAPSTPKPVMGYNYKYNGKEYQDELGLNLYDYGARNYDAAIGRWMNMDPMAEKYRRWSPYNYCVDNPVYFIDPDGMEVVKNWYGDTYTEADAEYLFAQLKSQMSSNSSSSQTGNDFEPQKNGNLRIEKGDNAAKLLKEYGLVVIDKNYKFKEGDILAVNNNITRAIHASNGGTVEEILNGKAKPDRINDNYVCDQCAQMANAGEEVTPQNATKYGQFPDPTKFDSTPGYSEVKNLTGINKGMGIISIGGQHTVSYYGTSNNGTVYVFTKNGNAAAPIVLPLNQVTKDFNNNQGTNFTNKDLRYFKKDAN